MQVENQLHTKHLELVGKLHLFNVTPSQKERNYIQIALSLLSIILGLAAGIIGAFVLPPSIVATTIALLAFSGTLVSLCCLLSFLADHREQRSQLRCGRSVFLKWNDLVVEYQHALRKNKLK